MARPKAPENTEQVTVRMAVSLANRFRRTSKGIGREIVDRLVRSVEAERLSNDTQQLAAAVAWIADQIDHDFVGWRSNAATRLALITAIQTWVEETAPQKNSVGMSDLMGPDDPATVGRQIARHFIRWQAALEESNREIEELMRPKSRKGKRK